MNGDEKREGSYLQLNTEGRVQSFVGRDAVELFRARAIASGLRMYAKCGMKPNRAYTPSAMMAAAAQITGLKFKAREYLVAAEAIDKWADTLRDALPVVDAKGEVLP